jgi:hypothetical protein
MTISWEAVGIVFSIIIGGIGLLLSLKKDKATINNLDAETFKTYQEALKESHDNYMKVMEDLEELKQKVLDYECHIKALVSQLMGANIRPVTLEQALKLRKGD